MRVIRKGALALAATLGCGLVAWFGVALAMEIADAKVTFESERAHYAD